MGKSSGGTRGSSASSPRGLNRGAEIQQVAIQQMRALNEANAPVTIAGKFTTRQGRDIDLDKVASEGRQEDTWNKQPLTPTSAAGKISESNVSVLGEDRYRFTHGKAPNRIGAGTWMFRIGSLEKGSVVEFPVISYSDAKRAARRIAARYGYYTITVMT